MEEKHYKVGVWISLAGIVITIFGGLLFFGQMIERVNATDNKANQLETRLNEVPSRSEFTALGSQVNKIDNTTQDILKLLIKR